MSKNENKVFVNYADFPKDKDGNIYVYRYEPVKYFKENIQKSRLMFSSLRNWDDRLETRYLKLGKDKLKKDAVGLCFTTEAKINAAAAWGMHKGTSKRTYVQIKYSLNDLIKGLEQSVQHNVMDFYIRNVEYKDDKEIVKVQPNLAKDLGDKEFVDLLVQKREDFTYEKEIRIIALGENLLAKKKKFHEISMGDFLKKAVRGLKLEPFSAKKVKAKNIPSSREEDDEIQDLMNFVKQNNFEYIKSFNLKKEGSIVTRSRLYEYGPEYSGKSRKSKKNECKIGSK